MSLFRAQRDEPFIKIADRYVGMFIDQYVEGGVPPASPVLEELRSGKVVECGTLYGANGTTMTLSTKKDHLQIADNPSSLESVSEQR